MLATWYEQILCYVISVSWQCSKWPLRCFSLMKKKSSYFSLIPLLPSVCDLKEKRNLVVICQPEQNAVLQHASLAALVQQAPPLDVDGLTRLFLPRWQRDLNQVAFGVIWGISAVTTWYQPCDGWSPRCLANPCHQLTGNKHALKHYIHLNKYFLNEMQVWITPGWNNLGFYRSCFCWCHSKLPISVNVSVYGCLALWQPCEELATCARCTLPLPNVS